jgi:hypothetical protein
MAGRRRSTVEVEIKAKDSTTRTVQAVEGRFTRLGNSIKANALKITAALVGVTAAFRQIEASAGGTGCRD